MDSVFPETRWSLVALAREDTAEAEAALNELCSVYYGPVHAYVSAWLSAKGDTRLEAEDLTSEFMAEVYRKEVFQVADPARGRLRQFLLHKLKWFFAQRLRAERAAKRDGRKVGNLSEAEMNSTLLEDPLPAPDLVFQKQWARTVIEHALARLEEERPEGVAAFHDQLLELKADDGSIVRASEQLGLTPGAAKQLLFRLRTRFGQLLREEVAQTLLPGEDLDEELRDLIALLKN